MDSKDSKDSTDDDTKGSDQTGSLTDFTFDEQHDDPKADVILVSTDNVGFRIHSWTFKKRRCVGSHRSTEYSWWCF